MTFGEATLLSRFIFIGLNDFLRLLLAPQSHILNQTLITCSVKCNILNLKDGILTKIVKKMTRQHRNYSLHNMEYKCCLYYLKLCKVLCTFEQKLGSKGEQKKQNEIMGM